MSLNFSFKTLIFLFFLCNIYAQESKKSIFFNEEKQYLGAVSLSFVKPFTSGNNFVGNSFEGKSGYNFNAHVYVFKNLYLGVNYGINQFDTSEVEDVGNLFKSNIEQRSFIIGYELLPLHKIRLGVFTSLFGEATFSNKIRNGFDQTDTGKLWMFGCNIQYEFIENLNVVLGYSWQHINTDIKAPQTLQTNFEKASFNNFSIGLKFNFGNDDLVDKIYL